MLLRLLLILFSLNVFMLASVQACSIIYFVDQMTGKIYVANNEDYWYDVKGYIQLVPQTKDKLARLWYGWDHFAQGGINEAGLFFDGAVTPEEEIPEGYGKPEGNLGDKILAHCRTVEEAIGFLEVNKVALKNAHMMFGDSSGNAAIVEWVGGERKVIPINHHQLIMTNFLLTDTLKGNYPCYRYDAIEESLRVLKEKEEAVSLLQVGNALGKAAQSPRVMENGRKGGTLYSTFIGISDMEFVLVYKLDNEKIIKLDLKETFASGKRRKIKLE